MLGPSRRRADAVCGGQSRRRPHRLVAQDTALSRRRHGFESRWGHARFRKPPGPRPRCAEGSPAADRRRSRTPPHRGRPRCGCRAGPGHVLRPSGAGASRVSRPDQAGVAEVRVVRGCGPDHLYRTGRQTRLGHAGQPRRLGSPPGPRSPPDGPVWPGPVIGRPVPMGCLAIGAPVVCSSGRGRLPSAVPITGIRRLRLAVRGPVEQLGVLATLSRWRSRVQIPSGPQGSPVSFTGVPARSGSSVGMSVRLKSGRSAVRPCP